METPAIVGQIVVIVLLILANGLFAMSEIAIISAKRALLQKRADEGDKGSATALDLANSPNRFLSTLQVGITLIGILAGAFGGATIAEDLGAWLEGVATSSGARWLTPYTEGIALVIVVSVTTYLSLVLGELVPKRLAMNRPERIARAVAGPMRALSRIASPVVSLLSGSTDLTLKLLGVHPSEEPPVTEEEITVLLEQGTEAGVFQEAEQDMVMSVLSLDERRASGLMTPRPDVVWLDLEEPVEELRRKITEMPYARFPVAEGSLDNLLGEVQAKDLLAQSLAGELLDIRALIKPSLYVPETMPALKVLEAFKQSGTEMAVVIDEYGSVQGLVTLQDILESIVGDMPSASEREEPEAVQREDGSWLLDGMLTVEELKATLHLDSLPDEERGLYQTLGGLVTVQIGRIPATTDSFVLGEWRFEVMDMDGPRVDKVLAAPLPPPEEPLAPDE